MKGSFHIKGYDSTYIRFPRSFIPKREIAELSFMALYIVKFTSFTKENVYTFMVRMFWR